MGSFVLFVILALSQKALAADSVQPYIDHLKKKGDSSTPSGESYTESLKKQLGPYPQTSEPSYIDHLRAKDPQLKQPYTHPFTHSGSDPSEPSFIHQEKLKLEPEDPTGAIKAYKEGRSELKPKIQGDINHLFGFRYGISLTRDFSASSTTQAQNFQDIYGSNYAPDLSIFYEYQPFHSEWFGNIGLVGIGGVSYFHGTGVFGTSLSQAGGEAVTTPQETKLQFFVLPVTVAIDYRFNLFRIVRPYILAGPSLIGYWERRETGSNYQGISHGVTVMGGVAILLDWFSAGSRWDMYSNYGIKHTYLTLDYSRLIPVGGDVRFSVYGVLAGFSFEY